jgi:hypothetical protein
VDAFLNTVFGAKVLIEVYFGLGNDFETGADDDGFDGEVLVGAFGHIGVSGEMRCNCSTASLRI